MTVIGLCGASGSGKTTACNYLAQKGYSILDCDAIYSEILYPGSPCLSSIRQAFGSQVIDDLGGLNRKELARAVFSSNEKRETLNRITFSFIKKEIFNRLQRMDSDAKVIVDAPLLFESGLHSICDQTVGILAPDSLKIQRLLERDKRTAQELTDRIRCQKTNDEIVNLCDETVLNDSDLSSFFEKLDHIFK